jgi:erythronate-4-phosphate dehydrogenase
VSRRFNIVVDADIPFIEGVLEPYCSVKYLKGELIDNVQVHNADALVIRTRTKCDSNLLNNSRVKAIFSATIGFDHIDTVYCKSAGISIYNAAGCNSEGVVQYVITSLIAVAQKERMERLPKTIGVVGAGSVGERVAALFLNLGFTVYRCDPPKKENLLNGLTNPSFGDYKLTTEDYYDLETILENCEIVSMHVPLNKTTDTMCSGSFFSKMVKGAIFINSSRGEVVDDKALIQNRESLGPVILDVYRDEPHINREVLKMTSIATPHIAGYSLEGKINATLFTLDNFAKHYSIEELYGLSIQPPSSSEIEFVKERMYTPIDNAAALLLSSFPIWDEDSALREAPHLFEKIRVNYRYRRELTAEKKKILKQLLNNG